MVAAEAVDGDLAERPLLDLHSVLVVGDVAMLAWSVEPGLGPVGGVERLELCDQGRGALAQGDEPDAHVVELGEVLLGGELLVEHQELGQGAVGALVEAAEVDHLA